MLGEESEPAAADALQPSVDALCVSIGGTAVFKLVLGAELSGAQVGQLCLALPTSNVRSLHLLHWAENTPCVYTMQCDWKYLNLVLVFILTQNK